MNKKEFINMFGEICNSISNIKGKQVSKDEVFRSAALLVAEYLFRQELKELDISIKELKDAS